MQRMNSAQFRQTFMEISEPTEVTKYGSQTIGVWYPAGHVWDPAVAQPPITMADAVADQQGRRTVIVGDGGSSRPADFTQFRPVPKPVRKRK